MDCLFCKIVQGTEPCVKILETDEFLVIQNKFPKAPIHLLVLDKQHRIKSDNINGKNMPYWDKMFEAIGKAVSQLGLDKTGYKLENNGAGYNNFEHEHFHILGGDSKLKD